jgi:hypothetical protein
MARVMLGEPFVVADLPLPDEPWTLFAWCRTLGVTGGLLTAHDFALSVTSSGVAATVSSATVLLTGVRSDPAPARTSRGNFTFITLQRRADNHLALAVDNGTPAVSGATVAGALTLADAALGGLALTLGTVGLLVGNAARPVIPPVTPWQPVGDLHSFNPVTVARAYQPTLSLGWCSR